MEHRNRMFSTSVEQHSLSSVNNQEVSVPVSGLLMVETGPALINVDEKLSNEQLEQCFADS